MVEIGDIIPTQRLESTLWSIVVFSYLPLGVLLMLIRIFLTLNYVCMQVVFNCVCSHRNVVRRVFEKIFLFVMGVTVNERNQKSRDLSSLWIANHLSNVDLYFLAALCNLKAAANLRGTNTLRSVLRCFHADTPPSDADVQTMTELTHNGIPVLVLPQPHPTNGNGLLKFREWPFADDFQIQPVVVRMKRPFPISGSTIESTWWSDLLWLFFCPLTIYDITILPTMRKKNEESSTEFKERVRKSMAAALNVPSTNYNATDVAEYLKRHKFEQRKPQDHLRDYPPSGTMRLAQRVKDVLPHVPMNVILTDIERTKSVDVTVTNILEGVVTFVAEPSTATTSATKVAKKSPTPAAFSRDPTRRHMTLQERKDEFLATARERYIAKHGYNRHNT